MAKRTNAVKQYIVRKNKRLEDVKVKRSKYLLAKRCIGRKLAKSKNFMIKNRN